MQPAAEASPRLVVRIPDLNYVKPEPFAPQAADEAPSFTPLAKVRELWQDYMTTRRATIAGGGLLVLLVAAFMRGGGSNSAEPDVPWKATLTPPPAAWPAVAEGTQEPRHRVANNSGLPRRAAPAWTEEATATVQVEERQPWPRPDAPTFDSPPPGANGDFDDSAAPATPAPEGRYHPFTGTYPRTTFGEGPAGPTQPATGGHAEPHFTGPIGPGPAYQTATRPSAAPTHESHGHHSQSGVARLEGTITQPPVEANYERNRSSLY